MIYNHPERDNCDCGSRPAPLIRMFMYVHYYLHKCSTWNIVRTTEAWRVAQAFDLAGTADG
jgi:hypothetical protein